MSIGPLLKPASAQILWNSQSPAGITDDIWCVTYGSGTFAAVTYQGNLLVSADGLTWSKRAIDPGVWLVSIAYGNGTWVVVGDKGTVLVSSDLTNWVAAKAATANKLNGVSFNGTVWVAVGEVGTIITSTDALNWVLQPAIPTVTGFLHGITSVSIWTGGDDAGFVSSTNGILVCGANGVLIGGSATGTNYTLLPTFKPPTQNLEAVLTIPGSTTIAAGWAGTVLYGNLIEGNTIPGALNLSPSTVPSVIYRGLTYGGGYYVAAGEQGTILTSTDGIKWTQRFSGQSPSSLSTATLLGAAYSATLQRFVVVGTGGTILTSNATLPIFGNVSTRGYVSSTQTFIGGFVVQGTGTRNVLIRGDGPVLASFGVSNPLADPVLQVYNSSGTVIATNTGWGTNTTPTTISSAATAVGAFPLPSGSADSAVLLTLQPGAYTVQITSAKGNSGIALFEAYTY